VTARYPGPLRDEPLALELHNTVYAAGGEIVDGLADRAAMRAWLATLAARLPAGGGRSGPTYEDLVSLRDAVRTALHAAVEGIPCDSVALDAINRASARAPTSRRVVWRSGSEPVAATDHRGADRADVVLGAFATDTIALLTGPRRGDLRACGAPGCVLLFLKDHPRREWCSNACGNRARQARHYRRTRHV
jgi:predicted RNA-binding Zn ribbon-like protein